LPLLANPGRRDALAAQFRAQCVLIRRKTLALDARSALIAALPGEWDVALDCLDRSCCCLSHDLLSVASLDRDAVNFLETCQTILDLFQAGTAKIPYAFFCSLISNFHRAAQGEDDSRNRFGYR